MNYAAVTPFYAAGLPTGLAFLQGGEIRGYVASDNRRSSFTQHLLTRIEGCAERAGVMVWSGEQLTLLGRLLGRPPKGHYLFLEDLLMQAGHASLSPAYIAVRLGLGEPADDALAQVFCLSRIHECLPELQKQHAQKTRCANAQTVHSMTLDYCRSGGAVAFSGQNAMATD